MQDVADQAEVSITTVYRYYPTKHHLFAALLFHLTQTAAPPGPTTGHAVADVTEFMAGIIRNMLVRPQLARAMITSVNARRAESTARGDYNLRRNIFGVAGIAAPTADQTQIALLLEQCAYGILSWAITGETTPEQAERDMRRACELLLAPWRKRPRTRRSESDQ